MLATERTFRAKTAQPLRSLGQSCSCQQSIAIGTFSADSRRTLTHKQAELRYDRRLTSGYAAWSAREADKPLSKLRSSNSENDKRYTRSTGQPGWCKTPRARMEVFSDSVCLPSCCQPCKRLPCLSFAGRDAHPAGPATTALLAASQLSTCGHLFEFGCG